MLKRNCILVNCIHEMIHIAQCTPHQTHNHWQWKYGAKAFQFIFMFHVHSLVIPTRNLACSFAQPMAHYSIAHCSYCLNCVTHLNNILESRYVFVQLWFIILRSLVANIVSSFEFELNNAIGNLLPFSLSLTNPGFNHSF